MTMELQQLTEAVTRLTDTVALVPAAIAALSANQEDATALLDLTTKINFAYDTLRLALPGGTGEVIP